MLTFSRTADLRAHLSSYARQGLRVGLVPTMGALHDGHLSLLRQAAERAELVVASVFVNPTQFGPNEDLARYPRDLEGDSEKLAAHGCHVLFAPEASDIYPPGFQTKVRVEQTTQGLCGAHRPGHFEGVATVVLKLFSIVRPDVAVFGEKDYQQLATIRAMERDLALGIEVLGAPIVRDDDGLALSSRNVFLSAGDRTRALALSRGLRAAKRSYDAGERAGSALIAVARAQLDAASIAPEYLELRHADDLRPLDRADEPGVMLVAARVGSTRLIDNLILSRPSAS